MTGILNILAGSISSAIKDGYFNLVSLLLPGDGTNGAQNNTFLDSSSNNFTITRNGNTTQGTFSPFSQTGWSNYFDGTGDNLSIPTNTAFAMGTGDFTIEAWIYVTAYVDFQAIIITDSANPPASTTLFLNFRNSTNQKKIALTSWTAQYAISNVDINLNEWTHVACVVSSGSSKIYINGSGGTAVAVSENFSSANNVLIGGGGGAAVFNGYISNLRVVKGTAVYTSNFTPSTTPLTAITNTSLLTCQSNRFIDNSSNAFALTVNGNTSVQAFSPFAPTAAYSAATNGGSGYFDGTGDYLTAPDNAAFSFGSGNFTVELWVYLNSSTSGASISFVAQGSAGFDTDSSWYFLRHSSDKLRFISTTDGGIPGITIVDSTNSFLPTTGQWYHLAAVRNGTTITLYVNGVSVGSGTNSTTFYDSTRAVGICSGSAGTDPINGYVSSLRIVKGTAVYTAGFTPPTSPLTNITNTSLLLNFTNAGITDATAKNDLETVGGAQISTTQSKFGGSSMYFDGTGDYLRIPSSAILALGTGAYTIEFWIYPNALAAGSSHVVGANSTNGIIVLVSNAKVALNKYGVGDVLAYNTALTTSTWSHVAVVREGTGTNQTKIYVNGTSVATGTDSNDWTVTSLFGLGANLADGSQALNGYIDDLRITKGYARYTANFTAPTAAFPLS